MNRITDKDLIAVVARINRVTNSPDKPYVDGKPQAGCYHLSHAYGGVALYRMALPMPLPSAHIFYGHGTKRELYDKMQAWLAGYELAKES